MSWREISHEFTNLGAKQNFSLGDYLLYEKNVVPSLRHDNFKSLKYIFFEMSVQLGVKSNIDIFDFERIL